MPYNTQYFTYYNENLKDDVAIKSYKQIFNYYLFPASTAIQMINLMKKTFSVTEASRNLTKLLDLTDTQGEVFIVRRNGEMYSVRPVHARSPLDIPGILTEATRDDVIPSVRESREMIYEDRRETYKDE